VVWLFVGIYLPKFKFKSETNYTNNASMFQVETAILSQHLSFNESTF
jgi:hypothetical protein